MKIFAGGKLKGGSLCRCRGLHATAAPTVALLDVYNKTYPRLTRAETPEAGPSAPSKK
jgi:hypothetical protein